MSKRFEGKVAIVTGGSSGIGKITAIQFAREGAKVVIATDKNLKGAEETVMTIKEEGGEAIFVQCDVSKTEDVKRLVEKTVEAYGTVHFAFNNAGIGPDGVRWPAVPIADCPEELWDRTVDINLRGVFLCMKYEIKEMLKNCYGSIVNCSSIGAFKVVPGFSAYAASKNGVIALSKVAAIEYAKQGIRVNVVCPGPIERTVLHVNLTSSQEGIKERITGMIPLSRFGEPEEVARAVLWLCSEEASFVTGHVMTVDGGMSAM